MKILIIGAGAVGQVYALYLSKAGHDISFFVKEKYTNELGAGLTLHRLTRRGHVTERLEGFGIVTSPAEVAARTWDQVWIAISGDALRGELAGQVLAAAGGATVIILQPDINNDQHVRKIVPPEQIVMGAISFLSFQSPLPGNDDPEGMAYFLDPLRSTLMAGPDARAEPAVAALRQGGLRAKRVRDIGRATAVGLALLQTMVAVLESNGWDYAGLAGSPAMKRGRVAVREAMDAVAAETGLPVPLPLKLAATSMVWRLLIPLSRRTLPFDVEAALRYHFSKVGAQTRMLIDSYVDLGNKHGLPTAGLAALRRTLPEYS
ncbi:ketopantoate reductase [Oleomonas cavernae]|uniref:Ketopantoate reductase n=1 Tax=Oleomonas cavernae TaxID=2320859 RepID=A0A418WGX1_9PROT|nr:2-dehydropantoate 2-reductase N-terminal domain-containing protein [Oleomonas cavernae]RJF89284.1 ketopantoate reductase [Oleomonas cavernae]